MTIFSWPKLPFSSSSSKFPKHINTVAADGFNIRNYRVAVRSCFMVTVYMHSAGFVVVEGYHFYDFNLGESFLHEYKKFFDLKSSKCIACFSDMPDIVRIMPLFVWFEQNQSVKHFSGRPLSWRSWVHGSELNFRKRSEYVFVHLWGWTDWQISEYLTNWDWFLSGFQCLKTITLC